MNRWKTSIERLETIKMSQINAPQRWRLLWCSWHILGRNFKLKLGWYKSKMKHKKKNEFLKVEQNILSCGTLSYGIMCVLWFMEGNEEKGEEKIPEKIMNQFPNIVKDNKPMIQES